MPYYTASVDLNHPDTEPCETCGSSWDELEINWSANDEVAVVFEARMSLGCYGGDSYTGDKAGLVKWLMEIIDSYDFDDGTSRKRDLIDLLMFINRNYS